jgi:hypothetical protein
VQMAGSYHAQVVAQKAASPQFVLPIADITRWPEVRKELAARHLPEKLLDQLHQQGLLYADERGAIIFVQRDLQARSVTGAYRMSRNGWNGTVVGSDLAKGRFYWLRGGQATDAVQRVVVGQTPIDVLALGLMEPLPKLRTIYLSVDGVLPLEYLQGFSPKRVRVAMNRDGTGQRLAGEAQESLPQVKQMHPEQEDWIGSLRVGRAIRQNLQGMSQPSQLEQ